MSRNLPISRHQMHEDNYGEDSSPELEFGNQKEFDVRHPSRRWDRAKLPLCSGWKPVKRGERTWIVCGQDGQVYQHSGLDVVFLCEQAAIRKCLRLNANGVNHA